MGFGQPIDWCLQKNQINNKKNNKFNSWTVLCDPHLHSVDSTSNVMYGCCRRKSREIICVAAPVAFGSGGRTSIESMNMCSIFHFPSMTTSAAAANTIEQRVNDLTAFVVCLIRCLISDERFVAVHLLPSLIRYQLKNVPIFVWLLISHCCQCIRSTFLRFRVLEKEILWHASNKNLKIVAAMLVVFLTWKW